MPVRRTGLVAEIRRKRREAEVRESLAIQISKIGVQAAVEKRTKELKARLAADPLWISLRRRGNAKRHNVTTYSRRLRTVVREP